MLVRIALVAALAALFVVPTAQTASTSGFFVGFTEDLPKEIGATAVRPAAELGARSFRITLMWNPGQTQLTSADTAKLDRAVGATTGMRVVLAVYADAGYKAPLDAAARDAYCTYVRNALTRYPAIRDVAVWNEPNKNMFWSPQEGAPGAYEALLARCYDVLHGAFSTVNVTGLLLSHSGNDNSVSTSPVQFIRGVGEAYRASGRTKRILDTVGHHPYPLTNSERPWRRHTGNGTIAQGDWNKLMYNLWLAFDGTAQPIPGRENVSIWYLEQGFQTAIDAGKEAAYTGIESVAVLPAWAGGEPDSPAPAETSPAPDQATQVVDAIRLAYCQPHVGALFNFLLADEPRLEGWQSGAFWADLTRKPSYPAFAQAIAEANAGSVDCGALKGGRPSPDFMPPTAASGLGALVRRDPLRVELSWQPASDDVSAVSYRISRNGNLYATTSDTRLTDTAVVSGKAYSYVVRAIDMAGNLSDPVGPVSATPSDTGDIEPPSTPASLTATGGAGPLRIDLAWSPSTDDVGVTGYEVLRDGVLLATVVDPAYSDAAVQTGRTYGYAVRAVDATGNRSSAATVTATAPDVVAPTAPSSLSASVLKKPIRVVLSWGAATDDVAVVGYRVYRNGVLLASTALRSSTDASAAGSTQYRYEVRAADAAGNLGPARAVTVKTPRG